MWEPIQYVMSSLLSLFTSAEKVMCLSPVCQLDHIGVRQIVD